MINNLFIKKILAPILLFIFFLMIFPSLFSMSMIIETNFFKKETPEYLLNFIEYFLIPISDNIDKLPNDIVLILIQSLPILIGAICYKNSDKNSFSFIGKLSFIVLIIGIFLSMATLTLFPSESTFVANINTKKVFDILINSNEVLLRNAITFLLLFMGLKIETPASKDT